MKNSFQVVFNAIPVYGICYCMGILSALFFGLFLAKRKKMEIFDFMCCAAYAVIGGAIGAKLLFLLVSVKEIIRLELGLIEVIRGGFVFYGGVLGGLLGVWIYAKQFRTSVSGYLDVFAAVIPFGHAIGRIGCHFAGCCYGVAYDGWGCIVYENSDSIFTPLEVPLFPVQLLEAICLFVLGIFLTFLFFKAKSQKGNVAIFYAVAYALIRFLLEFLRGDRERGVFFLSTSQYVSLGIAMVAIVILMLRKRKER